MTSCNVYDIGDRARVYSAFTNPEDGLPLDPSNLFLEFADPTGNFTSWELGTDPEIIVLGTGQYEAYIELTLAGYWWYAWRGAGIAGAAVEQITFYVRDTIINTPFSGYSDRQDLYNIYGTHNVNKWADLNNDEVEPDIINRINWSITQADAEINSRLLDSPWTIPFTAPFDPIITDISARLAGVMLYESRGITDARDENHELFIHRQMFEKKIRQLLAGQRNLVGATKTYSSWPQNIIDDNASELRQT